MTATGSAGGFLGLKHPSRRRSFGAAVVGPPGKFFEAVVAASAYVELYDEELEYEPYRRGIVTEQVTPARLGPRLEALRAAKAFPCMIGYRELPRALSRREDIDLVLFAPGSGDGGPFGELTLLLGHRAGALLRGGRTHEVVTAREICRGWRWKYNRSAPGREVLLVIDPLVLDPSLLAVRGNVEPGGIHWHPLTSLLRDLFAAEEVAAALILPCTLPRTDPGPPFILARLAAKVIAFALAGE